MWVSCRLFPKNESAGERWHARLSKPVSSQQHKVALPPPVTFSPGSDPFSQPGAGVGRRYTQDQIPATSLLSLKSLLS